MQPLGRPLAKLLVLGLAITALAGCLGPSDETGIDPTIEPVPVSPWATVALIDTGINPYHVDFRAPEALADVHPSEYVPGYPADIEAVTLTLDAADLEAALEADKAVWDNMEPGVPYWFKGTRATGISFYEERPDDGFVFSTGHGSMVASKAAGVEYSLCPECHIVAVQGFNGESVLWTSEQDWIDVQSNSWGPLPAFAWADDVLAPAIGNDPDLNTKFATAAARQAVFVASGNGVAGAGGGVGFPSPTDSTSGPPGVISVGGTDNGKTTLWTGWFPHVVADACQNWAMVGNTLDEYSDSAGGGTSAASPYTAGAAARLVQEARAILGGELPRDIPTQTYAVALEGTVLPEKGPLADGDFTLAELKDVLFHTASPVPQADEASGAECPPTSPYHTLLDWKTVPEGAPTYQWIGYGSVEAHSVGLALEVLAGTADALDRSDADTFYAQDQTVRETYHGIL